MTSIGEIFLEDVTPEQFFERYVSPRRPVKLLVRDAGTSTGAASIPYPKSILIRHLLFVCTHSQRISQKLGLCSAAWKGWSRIDKMWNTSWLVWSVRPGESNDDPLCEISRQTGGWWSGSVLDYPRASLLGRRRAEYSVAPADQVRSVFIMAIYDFNPTADFVYSLRDHFSLQPG